MEKLIIKTAGRHGQQVELAKSTGSKLSLGRGYSNDIILDDPYIDEEQITFLYEDDNWKLKIAESTNPVLINDVAVFAGPTTIKPGDRLTVGRSQLQLFTSGYKVEKTQKLLQSTMLGQYVSRPLIALLLLAISSMLAMFEEYQTLVTTIKWNELVLNALIFGALLIFWAASWALAGRLLRHQPKFFAQLGFTALVIIALQCISPLQEYMQYATNSSLVGKVSLWIILLVILSLLFYFNLLYATNIKNVGLTALMTSSSVLLFSFAISHFTQENFSSEPEMSNLLSPPFARVSGDKSIEEYTQVYKQQFDNIDYTTKE